MSETPQMVRLLKMLQCLSNGLKYTIDDLTDRYGISKRTFHRDKNTLLDAGFAIEKSDGFYWIDKMKSSFQELHDLPYFSEEEAWVMTSAIHSIDENNLLKTKLVKKLYSLYSYGKVAEVIVQKEHSENIHKLMQAIRQKKQVVLHDYHSANSDSITNRRVEPFDFTTNYIAIWAYDCSDSICKTFKNSRIGKVEVLDTSFSHPKMHKAIPMDVFRISGIEQTPIKLELSIRANELLQEEYPLAGKFIKAIGNNKFCFETSVSSFEGIGRFILGLYEDISIIYPDELKKFVQKKALKIVE